MFALDVQASVVENENNSHTAQLVNLAVELERGSFFDLVLQESHHPDILRTEEDNLPLVEGLPVVPSTEIHVSLSDVVELVYVRF